MLTPRDTHYLVGATEEQRKEYLRLRSKGASENWASMMAFRSCPTVRVQHDFYDTALGCMVSGKNDQEKRVKELRARGYDVLPKREGIEAARAKEKPKITNKHTEELKRIIKEETYGE